MARLKINSGIEAKVELPDVPKTMSVDSSDIKKLQQSMSSLANSVTNVNERLKSHESKTMKMVSQARNHIDNTLNNFKDPDEMSKQLEEFKKEINTKHNKMTKAMEGLKNQSVAKSEVVKEILKPEVTQITHHKDHNDDINMLNGRLGDQNKSIMENKKSLKDALANQKTINICLGVGLLISIILHIL